MKAAKTRKRQILFMLVITFLSAIFLIGCGRTEEVKDTGKGKKDTEAAAGTVTKGEEKADAEATIAPDAELTQADAAEFANQFVDELAKFVQLGEEYRNLGMQIQSKYAYGYAAASISSMRLCVDTLLHLGGEGATLEEVVGSRMSDWDEIAAYNYASPFPWVFEGLSLHAQDKLEEAQECYYSAALNPDYDIENGHVIVYVLAMLDNDDLKELKLKLTELEDKIYEAGIAEPSKCPRDKYCFNDYYLTALGEKELYESGDITKAMEYFETALEVNPLNGDNFASCAVASMYMGDMDKTIFYVNEGLWADPEHEGLNFLVEFLNERRP
jgi:tetratricopeptide (TPR) repeat protein